MRNSSMGPMMILQLLHFCLKKDCMRWVRTLLCYISPLSGLETREQMTKIIYIVGYKLNLVDNLLFLFIIMLVNLIFIKTTRSISRFYARCWKLSISTWFLTRKQRLGVLASFTSSSGWKSKGAGAGGLSKIKPNALVLIDFQQTNLKKLEMKNLKPYVVDSPLKAEQRHFDCLASIHKGNFRFLKIHHPKWILWNE